MLQWLCFFDFAFDDVSDYQSVLDFIGSFGFVS